MASTLVVFALLAADPRLAAAIAKYESAQFIAARDVLTDLVDASEVSQTDRAEARAYLAACLLALSDPGSARLQLRALARETPEAKPSPSKFPPELIAMANEIWADVEKKKPPPAPAPASAPPVEVKLAPQPQPRAAPPAAPSRALAFMPFGVGQLARDRIGVGTLFLGSEVALFAASVVGLVWLESLKVGDGARRPFIEGSIAPEMMDQAQALNAFYSAAFFVGLAVVVAGVIEANINWSSP